MITQRIPVSHASAAQSRALHSMDSRISESFEGFTACEVNDAVTSSILAPALMDTCNRGVEALEKIVDGSGPITEPDTFFEEFPLIARQAYQESASATLMNSVYRGAITRALIERNRVYNGPRSKIEKLHRARKYSQTREDAFVDYLSDFYKGTIVQDGVMEASRTTGALIEVTPHLVAQKGLGQAVKGLRDSFVYRAARSTFPIVNSWVRTTRENDGRLIGAIERPSGVRDSSNPHDKYVGMRFSPDDFNMIGYRVSFGAHLSIPSHERNSFGCPTNHNGHTIRLFKVILLGAVKSGALQYVIENSEEILSNSS